MPRVGERPAGAEAADDLVMPVLSLAAGALDWRARREAGVGFLGLRKRRELEAGAEDGVVVLSTYAEGLMKSLVRSLAVSPLERFAKKMGSTFSESSVSIDSALRLPLGEVMAIIPCQS